MGTNSLVFLWAVRRYAACEQEAVRAATGIHGEPRKQKTLLQTTQLPMPGRQIVKESLLPQNTKKEGRERERVEGRGRKGGMER